MKNSKKAGWTVTIELPFGVVTADFSSVVTDQDFEYPKIVCYSDLPLSQIEEFLSHSSIDLEVIWSALCVDSWSDITWLENSSYKPLKERKRVTEFRKRSEFVPLKG